MQRNAKQAPMIANRDKSQPWSGIPKRGTSTLNDLEVRVCAAEKINHQILDDIAELRRGLKVGTVGYNEHMSRTGLSDDVDSDVSVVQDSPNPKNQPRNARPLHTAEVRYPPNVFKILQKLTADVQDVNSRCGNQANDIQNVYQELKNFEAKLKNIMRNELRTMQNETPVNSNSPKTHKDPALELVEASISQMQSDLKRMHGDRLRFENNVHNSLLDQTTRTGEIEKFTKESVAEIRALLRDNAQEIISIRQGVKSELEDMSNQLNLRVNTALEKIQDDLANSRTDIEAALGRFSLANSGYETRLAEIEDGYRKMTKTLPDELNEIREEQHAHQKRLLNSLAQLDLAVEGLEHGLSDEKEQLKGVVAAEIKARTSNIQSMQTKLQELEENLNNISLKLNSSIKEVQERAGQRSDQSVQTSLQNIAEALQAVKVGLLDRVEKLEKETNGTVNRLSRGIKDLKEKFEATENNKSGDSQSQSQ
ncbi:unnamed protein product [Rodentolepis nana]|uniref:Chromosome segregation protein SMC n=1 Tax=Rodentolepis nana TaxID=102285 RepID=A0A0R3TRK3_RODNA|nr:unnamed protein product [Rodentolepis nana]